MHTKDRSAPRDIVCILDGVAWLAARTNADITDRICSTHLVPERCVGGSGMVSHTVDIISIMQHATFIYKIKNISM